MSVRVFVVPHGMGQLYHVIDPDSPVGYITFDSAKRAQRIYPDSQLVRTSETGFLNLVTWSVMDSLARECPNYGHNTTPQGAVLCTGPIVPSSGLCRVCHNKQTGMTAV